MAALLTTSSILTCPHGGPVAVTTSNTRTFAGGQAILRASDDFSIGGCSVNSPCREVRWTTDSESTVLGDDTLNEDSVGECVNAAKATQGFVVVVLTQQRIRGR